MKHTLALSFILFISQVTFSQNQEKCKEIAEIVLEAVSKQDFKTIKPYLANDFIIGAQKMPIAEKVLQLLVSKLDLEQYKATNTVNESGLILNYDVKYKNIGKKKAQIIFNSDNKIKKLELLEIQVKTLEKDKIEITYNPNNLIEIPFTQMGRLIVVKAKIDEIERDFILDSGAPFTIINSKYINEKEQETMSLTKGVNGKNISGMDIDTLNVDFYGIRTNQQAHVISDISHLEKDSTKIYGLIGYNFIKEYDILFDYENKTITLIKPDYFETYQTNLIESKSKIKTVSFILRNHIPIIPAIISNNIYNMGIDCGAEANLLDNKYYINVINSLEKVETNTLLGASKDKQEVKSAILKDFYIGGFLYEKTKFIFTDISHLNKNKNKVIDGLLGYEFLSKQLTLLSYKRKEIIIM